MDQGARRHLRPAVELAFHYARAVARAKGETSVPSLLRPLLGFSKLPAGVFEAVVEAIDVDEDFRLEFVDTIEEQDVGPIGWAWLARTDGWQSALGAAGIDAASADRLEMAEADVSRLQDRVNQLERDRGGALARAQRSESESQRMVGQGDRLRSDARAAESQATSLSAQVRDLTARATAAEQRATRAEAALGEERKRFKAELRLHTPQREVEDEAKAEAGRPVRRIAIRSSRGLSDNSPEGLRELLGIENARAVVDGYNVAMLGWPDVALRDQRTRLIAALGNFAARAGLANDHGVTFDVVFDGDDFVANDRTSRSPSVRVAWSPSGVTADDVIVDMAATIDVDVPVVVVTDDNDLSDRLVALGCNIVGSRALVTLVG